MELAEAVPALQGCAERGQVALLQLSHDLLASHLLNLLLFFAHHAISLTLSLA